MARDLLAFEEEPVDLLAEPVESIVEPPSDIAPVDLLAEQAPVDLLSEPVDVLAEPTFQGPEPGFVGALDLNLIEAGRILSRSVETGDPVKMLQSVGDAMRMVGRSAKTGLVGNIVKLTTGTAERERLREEESFKRAVTTDLVDELDELERLGKEGSDEYLKLDAEFQRVLGKSGGELLKEGIPEFSFSAFVEAVRTDPGAVAAGFVNVAAQDPELLLTPIGAQRAALLASLKTAKSSKAVQRTAILTAGAAGAGVTGAATVGAISTAEQLVETGEVDFGQVTKEAAIAGVISAPLGMLFSLRIVSRSIARRSGVPEEVITSNLKNEMKGGASLDDALDNVGASFQTSARLFEDAIPPRTATLPGIKSINRFLEESDKILKRQAGGVTIATVAGTAAVAGGAALGVKETGDIEGALTGAAVGAAVALSPLLVGKIASNTRKVIKNITKPDESIRINNFADKAEGAMAAGQRATTQFKTAIERAVPSAERREAISFFLEGDRSIKLNAAELKIADQVRKYFKDFGELGQKENVLDGLLDNYVPHLWRQGKKSKSEIIQALSKPAGKGTPFTKERIIPTLREGLDLGFDPITLDVARLAKVYGDSLNRAIANKQMIKAIKNETSPEGINLILPADKAPRDYKFINHPQLAGQKIHPDIEPSMKFLFDASDPGQIFRGILAVNFASKRMLVSTSFFHANALAESAIFAGTLPRPKKLRAGAKSKDVKLKAGEVDLLSIRSQAAVLSAREGRNVPIKMLLEGKAGDAVDYALRNGLMIGVIEDVGTDIFYATLKDAQTVANKIPVLGKVPATAVKIFEKANRIVDNIMWDRMHTGFKLSVFMKEFELELIRSAKRTRKNPEKFPLEDPNVIAADIAEFTNDAFGGQNWRKMVENVDSKFFRGLAQEVLSPSGRRHLQIGLFAPDWTISNIRILGKAIPGVAKNKRISKLHQRYFARGAVFFAIIGEGLNQMYSGKHLWENEDPGRVDLGDGRTMGISKQFVEPFHWAVDPVSTLRNKLGTIPKWGMEQFLGVKFVTKRGGPRMFPADATFIESIGPRIQHTSSKFVPIWMQQAALQEEDALGGLLGHTIYGKKEGE